MKADPRCIVSRGMGLTIEPHATPERSILHGLKRKLLKRHDTEHHQNNPLQTVSSALTSNIADCILAPPFPGEIALVTVGIAAAPPTVKRQRPPANSPNRYDGRSPRKRPSPKRTQLLPTDERTARPAGREPKEPKLVLLTQALVAVGPDVTVAPLRAGGRGEANGGASGERMASRGKANGLDGSVFGPRKGTPLSFCGGHGPIAIAVCGKLERVRLRAGQRRVVDSARAVAWTDDITWTSSGGGRGGTAAPGAAVTNFKGPGIVFVQTHSVAGLRRLFSPPSGALLQGGVSGFGRGRGRRAGGVGTPTRVEVGLSLKRGLAKRAKAGVRKLVLAFIFFALYIAVYSIATALLLEGREGIVNAPRHARTVFASLFKVARRVVTVLVKLGQEELWRKEAGDEEGIQGSIPAVAQSDAER